jgi:hypothetical protein
MAEQNPPSFMSLVATEQAYQGRNLISGLRPFPGCVLGGDLAVTPQGSPNMTVNVAAGGDFVLGTQSAIQGMYHCFNDATVILTIASNASGNPRWDTIAAVVQDQQYSGANNKWLLQVVQGTPAGSPADPALPVNSHRLARIVVPNGATTIGPGGAQGSIVDQRSFVERKELITTTQGPPLSGTFFAGDKVRDLRGALWVCSAAGTPGVWRWAGGGCYAASIYRNAAFGIQGSTDAVLIPFDATNYDPAVMSGGGGGRLTAPVPGLYRVSFFFSYTSGAGAVTGDGFAVIYKNGSMFIHSIQRKAIGVPSTSGIATSLPIVLAANDYIQIGIYTAFTSNASSTTALATNASESGFSMELIGAAA